MNEELRRQIQEELTGKEDAQVQLQFMSAYASELEEFLQEMTIAFSKWKELDQVVTEDRGRVGAGVSGDRGLPPGGACHGLPPRLHDGEDQHAHRQGSDAGGQGGQRAGAAVMPGLTDQADKVLAFWFVETRPRQWPAQQPSAVELGCLSKRPRPSWARLSWPPMIQPHWLSSMALFWALRRSRA